MSNGRFKTDMKTQNLYKITKLGQERIVNGQIRLNFLKICHPKIYKNVSNTFSLDARIVREKLVQEL